MGITAAETNLRIDSSRIKIKILKNHSRKGQRNPVSINKGEPLSIGPNGYRQN
jgi:hypothetical protein